MIINKEDRANYYKELDFVHATMDYGPFLEFVAALVIASDKLWLLLPDWYDKYFRYVGYNNSCYNSNY